MIFNNFWLNGTFKISKMIITKIKIDNMVATIPICYLLYQNLNQKYIIWN